MARAVGMDSPLLKHDYDRRRKVVEQEDEDEKPEGMFINQGLIDRLLQKKRIPSWGELPPNWGRRIQSGRASKGYSSGISSF